METTPSSHVPHKYTVFRRWAWCAWACSFAWGLSTVAAAPAVFPDATHQGRNNSLSLNASFTPDTDHVGRDLRVFALAWVPYATTAQGVEGRWYARSAQAWSPVRVGQVWPELSVVSGAASGTAPQSLLLLSADDMRPFFGAQIYLGYGVSSGDTASAMSEMLQAKRYRQIYTVNQSPSDTGRSTSEVGLEAATESRLQVLFAAVQKAYTDRYQIVCNNCSVVPTTTVTGSIPVPVPAPAPSSPTVGSATDAVVSGTTLQEMGVDEDDLVKSDGVSLYSLDGTSVSDYSNSRDLLQRRRFNATDVQLSTAERLPLPWSKGVIGTGLFLDTERQQAVAVAQGGGYAGIYDNWFTPTYWQTGVTELSVVDVGAALKVKRHLRLGGVLIGSRRIGSTLYLVLRSYPQWPVYRPVAAVSTTGGVSEDNGSTAVLPKSELPTLSIDQGPAQVLVNAADCLVPKSSPDSTASADTITLVAIDLAAQEHKHSARCFVGNTEAFYMSERNVYLATTRSTYTYSGRFPVYPQNTYTDIHQFALSGLEMNYQGSGSVVGHLGFDQNRKSFRMGEHNGVLRVFTQTAQRFGGWVGLPAISSPALVSDAATITSTSTTTTATASDSPGKLTMLQVRDGALTTIGELPNAQRPAPLGKTGEQLYASRFIGNRGYLVTYRLIDPLYIIDLSNPADPQILGELEVSGYSDYLFPLSDNLLLGVGKEAIADGSAGDGRAAWYQGVKLSLIDLSNPNKPVEAARSVIGQRGTDATVLHNHHGIALQTRPGSVRVSLPISLRDTPSSYASGKPSDYYSFTRNELEKFEIDLNAKTLKARIPLVSKGNERDISNDRSVLWNDQVHYYMGNDWLSAPW